MKEFIKALETKHPGYEVVDVRLSLAPDTPSDFVLTDEIDQELADAIRDAEAVDIRTLLP